jgi:uncharacterized membrane protein
MCGRICVSRFAVVVALGASLHKKMLDSITSFNIHPPLSSFPFALLSVVVFLEIISAIKKSEVLRKAITVNLCIAAISVICAFFSGYQAENLYKVENEKLAEIITYHHNLGRFLLFTLLACVITYFAAIKGRYNRKLFFAAYYLLLALCFALVILSGYIGGEMVFKHGIGVTNGN